MRFFWLVDVVPFDAYAESVPSWIETTNEKSSGEKRVIREKMSLASFPWKGNSNKPLSSKKIAGVRTRGKESRSVAA